MMKTILIICLIAIRPVGSFCADTYQAGVIAGSSIGLSGKYWLDKNHAISMQIGVLDDVVIQAGHLWRFRRFPKKYQKLKKIIDYYYVGAGGTVQNGGDDRVGVWFPVGLCKDLSIFGFPLTLSIEAAPLWRLSPSFGINVSGGLIIEYRFLGDVH